VTALGGPAWLQERRHAALERFDAAALPTAALEEWRYGRIDELDLDRFAPWRPDPASGRAALPEWLEHLLAVLEPAAVVVVRDGGPAEVRSVAAGVEVAGPGDAEPAGGPAAGAAPDAFGILNEAFSTPLTVRVPPRSRPPGPVVVVQWAGSPGSATFPRVRFAAGEAAEACFVEVSASDDVAALAVPVTEIDVADGAVVDYVHLQRLGPQMWQLGTQSSLVGRDATFSSHSVVLGGDYGRLRTDSALTGQGGTTRLQAAYFGSGSQTVDFRTLQDHRAPRTTSELLFKGAVANRARAVYSGLIRVETGARGTNAFQTNRNLVLHEGARADSVPNLEIEENDVRCSHASAVGPIADDQRFYLESRGVPPRTAERLITLGFLDDVLARVPSPALVDHLRVELAARLVAAEAREAETLAAGAAS
jgi:Fe-S cluster assembly protein SufD